MKARAWRWFAAFPLAPLLAAAAPPDTPAPQPVRIAVHDGQDGGAAVELRAFWFAAPPAQGQGGQGGVGPDRHPAMVLLHGCDGAFDRSGGLAPRYTAAAGLLRGLGIGALVVDSLGARGERELCTQKLGSRKVTMLQRRRDALAALSWLAAQPGTDAGRLGLLGWSNGGSAVLAAINENHPEVRGAEVRAAFAVAFYPGCEAERRRGYASGTRLLMLLGGSDDWTPPGPCQALAREAAGVAPEVEVYLGAFHGFDSASPPRRRADVANAVNPPPGVPGGGHPQPRAPSKLRLRDFLAAR